ncbi:MAG: RNase adapter RapZ [Mariprofundus sp.]|nr:RNase adapter RapZ [Mariprofundus sp.]
MLLISGLSGAGKSTVLHALEDSGFFCTDNLPVEMLHDWSVSMQLRKMPAAVCLDARSGMSTEALHRAIAAVVVSDEWKILFIEGEDEVLQRRFSTVRRRHPFGNSKDLMHAIRQERETMAPIRDMADLILDSSHLTPYELAEKVDLFWKKPAATTTNMACSVVSFSYKNGLPPQADVVFDMRFLPNPHYMPELRLKTGCDPEVAAFLQSYPAVNEAERHIQRWLEMIWPLMKKERKQYFTLAIGCSGGRHRSVYMTERIALWIQSQGGLIPTIQHRELGVVYRWDTESSIETFT